MEIVRLKKENYDELIGLLNLVFSIKNNKEMSFEAELPKMCVRDDEHMGRHFGIFENGMLVAAIGAYLLPVTIAGEKLLFSTVGNIATHPDYQGKGYMNMLIERAMQELDDMGADASRLGGLRLRYNRFGYESCGRMYQFSLNEHNRKGKFPNAHEGVVVERIQRDDLATLQAVKALHDSCEISVEREADNDYYDVYAAMVAWKNIPYAAKKDGRVIGYFCTNERGDVLAENYAESLDAMVQMLCAWQKQIGGTIYFYVYPHQMEYVRLFYEVCESVGIKCPCHFKFIHWEKVVGAFLRLKATYSQLPYGELTIEIKEYGTIRLFVNEQGVGCEKTTKQADVTLNKLQAARYLFGILPPECTGETNALAKAWLPLPLSWNLQDRV